MNRIIKLSVSMFVVFITIFGLFAPATPAFAMTCNSATIYSTVSTYSHPVSVSFSYGTNYNQVALGQGIPTPPQTVASNSYVEQLITGLTGNTTYYYKLIVVGQTAVTSVNNFTTPSCNTTPPPVQTCQDPSASNYGGAFPCTYPIRTCQDTIASNYGALLPCVYPIRTCQDYTATNYGGLLPCVYQTYNYTCRDVTATNYGGALPCVYQTYNYTCRDTTATNYGGALPCAYYQQPIQQSTLTAVTTNATRVLNTNAQLNSLISSSASSPINAWFEWGSTINLGNKTTVTAVGSLPSVIHADTLTGLNAGTTYYFRAVAENSTVRSVGSILSFTTGGVGPVIVYRPTTHPTSLVLITSSVDRNQAIVPTLDNTRPHPGDEINYTINYQNVGNGAVTNLTLQANLPSAVDYISSSPSTPVINGNNLVFNLGTLRANGNGVVTIKVRVRTDATPGTDLNFPATLSYIDPSGQPQSINTNVSAQVWTPADASALGAFVFGSGFFPGNVFGWLILIILILLLVWLIRYMLLQRAAAQPFSKKTITTVNHEPSTGKKITTTTVEE